MSKRDLMASAAPALLLPHIHEPQLWEATLTQANATTASDDIMQHFIIIGQVHTERRDLGEM